MPESAKPLHEMRVGDPVTLREPPKKELSDMTNPRLNDDARAVAGPPVDRARPIPLSDESVRFEVPERGGGRDIPAQALGTFAVLAATTLVVAAQTLPVLPDIGTAGPRHSAAMSGLTLSLLAASMAALAFQHLQHEIQKRKDDRAAAKRDFERDQELARQNDQLHAFIQIGTAQGRTLENMSAKLEDLAVIAQTRQLSQRRAPTQTRATSWMPDQFSGGEGEISTLFPAMRAEIRRMIDADGVLFGLMDAAESPPSLMRLAKKNGVIKWQIGLCLWSDRSTLLNLAATEFALRCYPVREADRGRPLDLSKLEMQAAVRPSPAYTRVHLPERDGVRVLHYDAWQDERHSKSLIRRLQAEELEAALSELSSFKTEALPITLRALRYFLGPVVADPNGFISKRAIEDRLASRSPSLIELVRISAESFVCNGDHCATWD